MKTDLDGIVVGAGFAGLYMVHKLKQAGKSVRAFEAGSGVGGTWFWNRYPGARCDVESMEYSYAFSRELEQEWEWSERYSSQPEILSYLNHVADRFDLRDFIQLNTRVEKIHYVENAGGEKNRRADGGSAVGHWRVTTDDGLVRTARFVFMATGCLSSTNLPSFPGLSDYAGELYHTSRWPHEGVDFEGKRVAVIGTGSSAVQTIPIVAKQAAHLTVYQRTPNYSVPAWNKPLAPREAGSEQAPLPGDSQHQSKTFRRVWIRLEAGAWRNLRVRRGGASSGLRRVLADRWAVVHSGIQRPPA